VKIEDLTRAVSEQNGAEPGDVRKILDTAFSLLGAQLSKEEKVELQGFGTFVRRKSRKSEKQTRTLFRSWSATGEKGAKRKAAKARKKARKKTRKSNKGGVP
jgi:nucleoid DNA-binding protein